MSVKKKLSLGLGFLFLIIFVLAFFCSFYIGKLSQEAGNILKDNYKTLYYTKNMISSLEDMRTSIIRLHFSRAKTEKTSDYFGQLFDKGRAVFEKNLKAENANITEIHEKEYAEVLDKDFVILLRIYQRMKEGSADSSVYFDEFQPVFEDLKKSIENIQDINMQAVVRKSQTTKRDAGRTIEYMAGIGVFCMILAFGYFWYFPLFISNSISYLATKMRELLSNMGIPLDIRTEDEFHVILQAINLIENKYSGESKNKNKGEK